MSAQRIQDTNSSNFQTPQWSWQADDQQNGAMACFVYFSVPTQLDASVFLYYKLTNYYQNHRRYVKSIDSEQLLGHYRSSRDLQNGNCKPLARDDATGLPIYPCGLIANSVFNGSRTVVTGSFPTHRELIKRH